MGSILRSIAIVLIILVSLIIFALTPAGLQTGARLLTWIVPGKLQYQKISGLITGPITIDQFKYQNGPVGIQIGRLHWQWRFRSLLIGHLNIKKIEADHLQIVLPVPRIPLKDKLLQIAKHPQLLIRYGKRFHKILVNHHFPLTISIQEGQFNDVKIRRSHYVRFHPTNTKIKFPVQISTFHFKTFLNYRTIELHAESQIDKPKKMAVNINVSGNLSNYLIHITAHHSYFKWIISAFGNDRQIHISLDEDQSTHGYAKGLISFTWFPLPIWDLSFVAHRFDFDVFHPKGPKQVNINLQTHGKINPENTILSFDNKMNNPDAAIKLTAFYNQTWNITWNTQIEKLGAFLSNWSGRLKSQGRLEGSLQSPQTTGILSVENLKSRQIKIANAQSRWNIDATDQDNSYGTLTANDVRVSNLAINTLKGDLKGKLNNHDIQLLLSNNNAKIKLRLQGGVNNNLWQGKITALQLLIPQILQSWNLAQPATLSLSHQTLSLQPLYLKSSVGGQIGIDGSWQRNRPWNFNLTGQDLPLKLLASLLPSSINLDGKTQIHGFIKGVDTTPKLAQFKLNLDPGKITYSANKNKVQNPYRGGQVIASWSPTSGLFTQINISLLGKDYFHANIHMPGYNLFAAPAPTQPITGHIQAELYQLKPWLSLIPFISVAGDHGRLDVDMQLSGTIKEPILLGNTSFNAVKINIPALNLDLTQVTLAVRALKNTLEYQGITFSGENPLRIVGRTVLQFPNLPTDLKIQGDHILVANTSEYLIYASPNISIHFENKNFKVSGEILIPEAEIKPLDFRNIVTLPKSDVVFIGAPKVKKSIPWLFSSHLLIRLGDQVHIDTSGVVGDLHGQILLLGEPDQTTLAAGKVSISNGTYSTYGHMLNLDSHSYILYANTPLNDPILFIDASKTINVTPVSATQQLLAQKYVVGVSIRGTYYNPQLTLFSSPSDLSQSQIFSYLILGENNNLNASGNLNLLSRAANALKGSQGVAKNGLDFINQIKQGLGFSELGVVTEKTVDAVGNPVDQQTSFVVGRHLSKRIYLRYSQALEGFSLTGNNEITIRYLLNHHWALQAMNNTLGTGIDILYTIEKN